MTEKLTHDSLKFAARTLPQKLRDEYFEGRTKIRDELHKSRYGGSAFRNASFVMWDDPEFIALCAVLLAQLQQRVNHIVSRFGSS